MSQHPLDEKWQTYWIKNRLNSVCTLRSDDVLFLESLVFHHVFSTDLTQREMTYEVHLFSSLGKALFTQEKFHHHFYMPGEYYPTDDALNLLQTFFDEVEIYLYFDLSSYERSIYGY